MLWNFRWCLAATAALWGVSVRAQVVNLEDAYDQGDPVQVGAHAAAESRRSQLTFNYQQLANTLSVDRDSPYFPGEPMRVEIRIANPTPSPLEIPDPNDPLVQCFVGGIEETCRVPLAVKSTVIQPGQVITLTFDSEDKAAARRWRMGEAPNYPGKHHLTYLLGGRVEFEVGAPVLEASVVVPLQVFKTYQEAGMPKPETLQYAALVVAARLGDEHLLLVGRKNMPNTYEIKPQRDGTLSPGDAGSGAPWIRLATSPSAITSLKATADDKGRITIQYATSDGIPQTLYLDETRHPGR